MRNTQHIVDFDTLLARLKMYILREEGKVSGTVFDKRVAEELNIDATKFRSLKARGVIPFKEVLDWCYKKGIDINRMFSKR